MKDEQEAFAVAKASWRGSLLVKQITAHQLLEQFIPIQLADHTACIVIIGDISGVLCEQVADDLIDGVIAFFIQSIEYIPKYAAHILLVITGYGEFNSVVRHGIDLLKMITLIITQNYVCVKP